MISNRPRRNPNLKRGYVYAVRAGSKVKIGKTKNIESRVRTLQTGNPYTLEVIFAAWITWPEEVETFLHHKYRNFRIKGEWFILDDTQLADIEHTAFNYIWEKLENSSILTDTQR